MGDWLDAGRAGAGASAVNSAIPGPCVALTLARDRRGGARRRASRSARRHPHRRPRAWSRSALAVLLGLFEVSADARVRRCAGRRPTVMIAHRRADARGRRCGGTRSARPVGHDGGRRLLPPGFAGLRRRARTTWSSSWRSCRSTPRPERLDRADGARSSPPRSSPARAVGLPRRRRHRRRLAPAGRRATLDRAPPGPSA